MAKKHTDEFRRDAVRIATTSGLTRPQIASDLEVGLSTLNKWGQKHQHNDLMSGPHEDVEKGNTPSSQGSPSAARGEGNSKKGRQPTDRQGMFTCPRGFFAGQSR